MQIMLCIKKIILIVLILNFAIALNCPAIEKNIEYEDYFYNNRANYNPDLSKNAKKNYGNEIDKIHRTPELQRKNLLPDNVFDNNQLFINNKPELHQKTQSLKQKESSNNQNTLISEKNVSSSKKEKIAESAKKQTVKQFKQARRLNKKEKKMDNNADIRQDNEIIKSYKTFEADKKIKTSNPIESVQITKKNKEENLLETKNNQTNNMANLDERSITERKQLINELRELGIDLENKLEIKTENLLDFQQADIEDLLKLDNPEPLKFQPLENPNSQNQPNNQSTSSPKKDFFKLFNFQIDKTNFIIFSSIGFLLLIILIFLTIKYIRRSRYDIDDLDEYTLQRAEDFYNQNYQASSTDTVNIEKSEAENQMSMTDQSKNYENLSAVEKIKLLREISKQYSK